MGSLCFEMEVSRAVVSRVRVLAITHILVGALLVIFGIANGVTQNSYDTFNSTSGYFGAGAGVWVSFRFCEVQFNIFLVFAAVLFSCRPTHLLVAVEIEVETQV